MRTILLLSIFVICCTRTETRLNQHFYIGVRNFYGADGVTHYIVVTPDSTKIYVNCDFADCSEKVIYQQRNNQEQINDFGEFLTNYRFDTLKTIYEDRNVMDGLFRTITIQRNSDIIKSVRLNNYDHPTVDALLSQVETLISDKKYRIVKRPRY